MMTQVQKLATQHPSSNDQPHPNAIKFTTHIPLPR